MKRVGSFEAKTHLPELLRRVEAGEGIIITRHGQDVAQLIPPPYTLAKPDTADAIARWRKARRGVKLGGLSVRKLIEEGRR